MDVPPFNYSPIVGHCGFLSLGAVSNKAAMNIHLNSLKGSSVDINCHFSGINAQECDCWLIW